MKDIFGRIQLFRKLFVSIGLSVGLYQVSQTLSYRASKPQARETSL